MDSRPQGPAFHRLLVRLLLPLGFRRAHGRDLTQVFAGLLEESRTGTGPHRPLEVWAREIRALVSLSRQLRRELGTKPLSGRSRAGSGVSWLDLKLGFRMLAKHPGLTLAAGLALVVGIPVGLAPIHAARSFEKVLPVEEGERIHMLKAFSVARSDWERTTVRDYAYWRDRLTSFETIGAARRSGYNLNAGGAQAAPVIGVQATASTFEMLQVPPALGRTLMPSDEAVGGPDVVVISHDLWHSRFGGNPDMIGSVLRVSGVPHVVVGVMPKGFLFPYRDHLWLPLRWSEASLGDGPRALVYGRLADGVSAVEAQAELAAVGTRPDLQSGASESRLQAEVVPYTIGLHGAPKGGLQAIPEFYFFQMFALLILVVACANIAMLILARTSTRSSELAVRTALGASRRRVVVQLFTESLVLSVLAAGLGLLIADQIAQRLSWLNDLLPYWVDFRITPEIVVWALGLAALSAALVGAIPALKVTGKNVQQSIQRAAAGRSGVRFGGLSSLLIVADVAVAVAAVGIAIGLADGLTDLQNEVRYPAEEILTAELRIPAPELVRGEDADPLPTEARAGDVQRELTRRLEAEPEVVGVMMASVLPGMDHRRRVVEVEGEVRGEDADDRAWYAYVDDRFFAAMDQAPATGRGFTQSDLEDGAPVVVVNDTFVQQRMGGRNAIGRRVRYIERGSTQPSPWLEVVGVVDDLGMNAGNPGRDTGVYHPLGAGKANPVYVAVRLGGDPNTFVSRLREIAAEVEPTAIVSDPTPLSEVFSFEASVLSWVKLGMNAMIAILLALSISGTYALMTFTVAERTREIGIRSALGAPKTRIVLTIGRRALLQLGIGVLLGTAANAFLLTGFKAGGRIPTHSPLFLTILTGVVVMVVIGSLACIGPTRKALRIQPTEALGSGG